MATGHAKSGTHLQVLYDYEYVTDYGRTVAIKEGDECLLLKKSNENWWLVVKEGEKKPLYVPASYVKVIYKTVVDISGSRDESDEVQYDQGSFDENSEAPTKSVPSPTDSGGGGEGKAEENFVISAHSTSSEVATKVPPSPTNNVEEITLKKSVRNSTIEKRPSFKSFQKNLDDNQEEDAQQTKKATHSVIPEPTEGEKADLEATSLSPQLGTVPATQVDYVNLNDFRKQAGLPELIIHQPSEDGPDYANLDFIQESIRKRKEEENTAQSSENSSTHSADQKPETETASAEKPVTTPERAEDSEPLRIIDDLWEVHLDTESGKEYYYNKQSHETSWELPEGVTDDHGSQDQISVKVVEEASSPASPLSPAVDIPDGWKEEKSTSGETYFFNDITKEKWFSSVDESGRMYYYKENTKESLWALPSTNSQPSSTTPPPPPPQGDDEDIDKVSEQGETRRKDFQQLRSSWATWGTVDVVDIRRASLPPGVLSHVSPKSTLERIKKEDPNFSNAENKYLSSASDSVNSMVSLIKEAFDRRPSLIPISEHFPASEVDLVTDLKGSLNKTKILEANKKVKKNWEKCYAVLNDTNLYFYKDQKASLPRGSSSIGKPDTTLDIQGATIMFGSKEKTSKKHTIQLVISNGTEYLLQIDDPNRLHAWYVSLSYAAKQKGLDVSDDSIELEKRDLLELEGAASPKLKQNRKFSKKLTKSATVDEGFELTEEKKNKIRERLRKFLRKRPTPEALAEKGIIKESVFGSRLGQLCEREKSSVPKFVLKILETIEKRGLEIDGIYRVNGNLAQVQKLRFMVDHSVSDRYDFENPEWDVHVLTSAIKLFFRELKEPLFPFKFLNKFTAALQLPDAATKQKAFHDLIHVMPIPNRETLKALFKHLTLVMAHSATNRMQSQNLAIVFGPTLMWAEEETMSMAVSMVCQTQIVDHMLLEFNHVFS